MTTRTDDSKRYLPPLVVLTMPFATGLAGFKGKRLTYGGLCEAQNHQHRKPVQLQLPLWRCRQNEKMIPIKELDNTLIQFDFSYAISNSAYRW